jgi:type III secretion protein W
MSDGSHVPGINSSSSSSSAKNIQQALEAELELVIEAAETETSLMESGDNALFGPMYLTKDFKKLDDHLRKNPTKESEETEKDDSITLKLIDDVTKLAQALEEKNSEINHRALLGLKADIKESDDAETIYQKVRQYYKDEYLADEVLKFLEQTTNPHMNLGKNIRKARMLLNERHEREVKSGRNINEVAKEFAQQGLGTTGSLRDLYREVTKEQKDPATLFDQLNEAYDFNNMKKVLAFLLHSLGSDMKSKGPSIPNSELARLFSETRTMQAILGIYRFFLGRMKLIKESLARENLAIPKKLTFELLAKLFSKFIQERYPSPDKVLRIGTEIGIDDEILAQIIIYTQYRDALRGVSPKLFANAKHRGDLLMSLIETISELDDLLEEEEEEEEKKKGWSDKDTVE